MIALGIILGEGYPICRDKGVGIRVGMCDRKAVEMVARSWGTSVFMDRRKKPACPPTPDNPAGHSFKNRALLEHF